MRACRKTIVRSSIFILFTLLLCQIPAQAQVIFADDFNSPTFNTTQWGVGDWQLGRAYLRNQPTLNQEDTVTYVTLRLDTYNPDFPGELLRGAEIYSRTTFTLPKRRQGLNIKARVRLRTETQGLVASFFTWGFRERRGTTLSDEIDFEYLTNLPTDWLLLTTWNDWDYKKPVYNDDIQHSEELATVNGLNRNTWTNLQIHWLKDRTEWYVNDTFVYSTTSAHANDPMSVRFNLWAPAASWTFAYDTGLQPAPTAAENISYFYDIDYIEVTEIP